MTETQQQVIDWLAACQVGISSKCMAMYLGFGKVVDDGFGPGHPHDPVDLNRCLKLLQRAPGLRESLPKMADLSPEWAALVSRWDEIEASHLAEVGIDWTKGHRAPRTFRLMEEALYPKTANQGAAR